MDYTTEALPLRKQLKKNQYKKYRDEVCNLKNLHFQEIDGDGDCFFGSLSALLKQVPNPDDPDGGMWDMDSSSLRQEVTAFLRLCAFSAHMQSIWGERCAMHMEHELHLPLEDSVGNYSGFRPTTLAEYLHGSSMHGVWVQGYHWLWAVAAIFDVCPVVVIHNHEHVYLFGDGSKQRIHFYKCEAETHYDALPHGFNHVGHHGQPSELDIVQDVVQSMVSQIQDEEYAEHAPLNNQQVHSRLRTTHTSHLTH